MSKKTSAAAAVLSDSGKAATVQQEQARLMGLFNDADPNKLDFIRDAVCQVAWLGITIIELQSEIDENGPVLPYDNGGNQKGVQANPACKILKDYQQLYNTLFRALLPVLPDRPRTKTLDLLRMDFYEPEPQTPEDIAAEEQAAEERRIKREAEFAEAKKKLDEMHAKFGQ